MSYETTDPAGARERLDSGDWIYLDVRSIPEYEAGHVPGAYNVPLLHLTPHGMEPNDDFVAVVERRFGKDAPIVVGCKVGGRSARACDLLASRGYTRLANMDGGFSGRYDPLGRHVQAGWSELSYPVSEEPVEGRTYRELSVEK